MQTRGHILPPFRAQINGRILFLLYVCVCVFFTEKTFCFAVSEILFSYDLSRVLEMGPIAFYPPGLVITKHR